MPENEDIPSADFQALFKAIMNTPNLIPLSVQSKLAICHSFVLLNYATLHGLIGKEEEWKQYYK